MEEAAGQLPRRAEAAERDAGAGVGRQAALPLEVHGADAVPAALHEQPQEAGAVRAAARARARRQRPRAALLRRLRLRARLRAQAQELRPARPHRAQARLSLQGMSMVNAAMLSISRYRHRQTSS